MSSQVKAVFKTFASGTTGLVVGDQRYITTIEVGGKVIKTDESIVKPCTNRGIPTEEGWLGSWTNTAGTTFDSYARGLRTIKDVHYLCSPGTQQPWGTELFWS